MHQTFDEQISEHAVHVVRVCLLPLFVCLFACLCVQEEGNTYTAVCVYRAVCLFACLCVEQDEYTHTAVCYFVQKEGIYVHGCLLCLRVCV